MAMEIARGNTRTVLIFKNFVLKFPRFYLSNAMEARRTFCKDPEKMRRHVKRHLLRGVGDNWREFIFYFCNHSSFLMPTFFSFFGLLNIQKRGEIFEMHYRVLWEQILQLTNNEAWADYHVFSEVNNFCQKDGRLKIFDYGSVEKICRRDL